jgi:hypothetical protein
MRNCRLSLRKDETAASPAISTVILTAAVVVMILVAMTYAQNILNLKMAENEFTTNKQFMQTTGQQVDDIAWTIDRTQTVSSSSRYGNVQFKDAALKYTIRIQTSSGWENLTLDGSTGMVLFNMPVSSYSLGNNYFQRIPSTANSSFLQFGSSAPVSQVFCEEKLPMSDGSFSRVALIPTMRVLTSTINNPQSGQTNYFKFYLPVLDNGTNRYLSQSLTLTGDGISKIARSGVNQVSVSVSFPLESSGFDSSFFKFNSTTITLNNTSTPKLPVNSVVEFYVGKVIVSIGAV